MKTSSENCKLRAHTRTHKRARTHARKHSQAWACGNAQTHIGTHNNAHMYTTTLHTHNNTLSHIHTPAHTLPRQTGITVSLDWTNDFTCSIGHCEG